MKVSIYNTYINIGSRHTLLYNSFTGIFMIIRDNTLQGNDLKEIALTNKQDSLYGQLCKAGMLVNDHLDETALLQQRIDLADNNYSEYILNINPTLDCNFRCWYCYENHQSLSAMNEVIVDAIKRLISDIIADSRIRILNLGFFGGEPLLYFENCTKSIIEHAKLLCKQYGKNLHIHFTTNGVLLTPKRIAYLSQFDCGFQITLDGGQQQHDSTRYYKNGLGSYSKIIQNIQNLLNTGLRVIVRVNYTSANVTSVISILSDFKNLSPEARLLLQFDFQRIWQERGDSEDTTEERIKEVRRVFRAEGFLVLSNYIAKDVRNSCYGDKVNHALINYNGDVFGCTARDFTHHNRIGVLDGYGHIIYDEQQFNLRKNSKFSKPICKTCRIAPICGGGCRQRALEGANNPECTMGYSDKDMDRIVTDIFEHSFNLNSE